MRGKAYRGSNLNFGEFGLQALECGRISSKQIEASRVAAVTQFVKEKSTMDLSSHYDNDGKAGGGKGYKRRDFLKASHIPAKGATANSSR